MLYEGGNTVKDEIEVSGILNNFYLNIVRHVTGKERDGLDLNDVADFQSNEHILEQIKEKYSTHPGIKRIKDKLNDSSSFSFREATTDRNHKNHQSLRHLLFSSEDCHNFADDNTVSTIGDSLQALLEVLTEKANTAIDWFQLNDMLVNPWKFKAVLLEKNKRNTSEYPIVLTGHELKMQESVTLLGGMLTLTREDAGFE